MTNNRGRDKLTMYTIYETSSHVIMRQTKLPTIVQYKVGAFKGTLFGV